MSCFCTSIHVRVSVCFSRLLMDSRTIVIHENTSYTFIVMSFLETLSARTMPYTGSECIGISICESTALLIELVSYRIVLYRNTQDQRQLLPNIIEPSKPRYMTHSLKRRLPSGFWGKIQNSDTWPLFITSDVLLYCETHFCCDYVASYLKFRAKKPCGERGAKPDLAVRSCK